MNSAVCQTQRRSNSTAPFSNRNLRSTAFESGQRTWSKSKSIPIRKARRSCHRSTPPYVREKRPIIRARSAMAALPIRSEIETDRSRQVSRLRTARRKSGRRLQPAQYQRERQDAAELSLSDQDEDRGGHGCAARAARSGLRADEFLASLEFRYPRAEVPPAAMKSNPKQISAINSEQIQ